MNAAVFEREFNGSQGSFQGWTVKLQLSFKKGDLWENRSINIVESKLSDVIRALTHAQIAIDQRRRELDGPKGPPGRRFERDLSFVKGAETVTVLEGNGARGQGRERDEDFGLAELFLEDAIEQSFLAFQCNARDRERVRELSRLP